MKMLLRSVAFVLFIMLPVLFGQGYYPGGNFNPDSLETVTVSGRVMVDSVLSIHPMYYLDANNDNQPDYMLNFGPYWYEPDSSTAVRPEYGDSITVYGGAINNSMMDYQMLVVYEINGEFWREPFDPFWNDLDGFVNMGGRHDGECNSFGFGWQHDSLKTVTVSGTVFLDSTFIYSRYYLDSNNDSIPDYMLNFGPPWYETASGAVRPDNGEKITITGGEIDMLHFNMILVYEINGISWQDSSGFGNHFGGGWMNSSYTQSQRFHSPFDTSDWMEVHPGWHMGGGMHGSMMMPDSIFTQIFELFPDNLPAVNNQNAFAAYQFDMLYPDGAQGMGPMGGCGGMMQFNNNIDFQLHFTDMQLISKNIDKNTIKVKYYDNTSNSWMEMSGTNINTASNTITFSNNNINNLIILTGEKIATGVSENQTVVKDFQLYQNYPNPFNPSTNIKFELKENSHVTLSVYNIIGQKVAELINSDLSAGIHTAMFNAANLSSGVYFYELKAGSHSSVKKMELLK
jgi:hypothetical protein